MRKAKVERNTKETEIRVELNLDGKGNYRVSTNYGFLTHMLELFLKFSSIDGEIKAKGDIEVDTHHLVEDTGICIGEAIKKALGEKKGIRRFGFASMPMDETLVNISLDISGRPFLVFNVPDVRGREEILTTEEVKEFFTGFVNHSGITLHINFVYGKNTHHIIEAIFKGVAVALKQAIKKEGKTIPSTKGKID